MTNEIRRATAVDLPPDAPVIVDEPQRPRRLDADTMFAIAATIIGASCILVSAIALISACVVPLGVTATVVAAVTAAAIAAVLPVGALWVWILERSDRQL